MVKGIKKIIHGEIKQIIKESEFVESPLPKNIDDNEFKEASLKYVMSKKVPEKFIINAIGKNEINKRISNATHTSDLNDVLSDSKIINYLNSDLFNPEYFKRALISVIGKQRANQIYSLLSKNKHNNLIDGDEDQSKNDSNYYTNETFKNIERAMSKFDFQKGELSKLFGYIVNEYEKLILSNPQSIIPKLVKIDAFDVTKVTEPIKDVIFKDYMSGHSKNVDRNNNELNYEKDQKETKTLKYNFEEKIKSISGIDGSSEVFKPEEFLKLEDLFKNKLGTLSQKYKNGELDDEEVKFFKSGMSLYKNFRKLILNIEKELLYGRDTPKEVSENINKALEKNYVWLNDESPENDEYSDFRKEVDNVLDDIFFMYEDYGINNVISLDKSKFNELFEKFFSILNEKKKNKLNSSSNQSRLFEYVEVEYQKFKKLIGEIQTAFKNHRKDDKYLKKIELYVNKFIETNNKAIENFQK